MGVAGAQHYTVIASDIILFLYKFSINCNHRTSIRIGIEHSGGRLPNILSGLFN